MAVRNLKISARRAVPQVEPINFSLEFCSTTVYYIMFKRMEKRRRKRVEEEELGIDEDMKEILGMHDTDSEESDSDSDQDESSAGDVNEEQQELSRTDKGWESDQEEDEEEHVITVQEALRDPVYLVSLQPDVKACIVCPGKLLKGAKMVELHRTSKACTLSLFVA
jgi:hypothetical protein